MFDLRPYVRPLWAARSAGRHAGPRDWYVGWLLGVRDGAPGGGRDHRPRPGRRAGTRLAGAPAADAASPTSAAATGFGWPRRYTGRRWNAWCATSTTPIPQTWAPSTWCSAGWCSSICATSCSRSSASRGSARGTFISAEEPDRRLDGCSVPRRAIPRRPRRGGRFLAPKSQDLAADDVDAQALTRCGSMPISRCPPPRASRCGT